MELLIAIEHRSDAGAGAQGEHREHRAGAQAQALSTRRHELSDMTQIEQHDPQVCSPLTQLYIAVPPRCPTLRGTAFG
jgi:hypothetical protein